MTEAKQLNKLLSSQCYIKLKDATCVACKEATKYMHDINFGTHYTYEQKTESGVLMLPSRN